MSALHQPAGHSSLSNAGLGVHALSICSVPHLLYLMHRTDFPTVHVGKPRLGEVQSFVPRDSAGVAESGF